MSRISITKNLLEMQNPGSPPRPAKSEFAFYQDPQVTSEHDKFREALL